MLKIQVKKYCRERVYYATITVLEAPEDYLDVIPCGENVCRRITTQYFESREQLDHYVDRILRDTVNYVKRDKGKLLGCTEYSFNTQCNIAI